jgi:hypothetical protein
MSNASSPNSKSDFELEIIDCFLGSFLEIDENTLK